LSNQWTEADSSQFLRFSEVITPSRREQMSILVSLIPGEPDERFQVVELGHGGGEWGTSVLSHFTSALYLGLDGSDIMRETAAKKLSPFADRVALQPFSLAEGTWRQQLPRPLRCVFSSLVVHHLDDAGKRQLFTDIFEALEPGGALLLADIVQPVVPWARAAVGAAWDALVREQSIAMTGSDRTFKEFKEGGGTATRIRTRWTCPHHCSNNSAGWPMWATRGSTASGSRAVTPSTADIGRQPADGQAHNRVGGSLTAAHPRPHRSFTNPAVDDRLILLV